MFDQTKSPPACERRGAWECGPPRVRGRKMRHVEVTQALRRRPPTRPARPTSAAAPGAGTVKFIMSPLKPEPTVREVLM